MTADKSIKQINVRNYHLAFSQGPTVLAAFGSFESKGVPPIVVGHDEQKEHQQWTAGT